MKKNLLGVLALALVACQSSPPPITEGMKLGWTIGVAGKGEEVVRVEFSGVPGGWRMTSQAEAAGELKPAVDQIVDEQLIREDGKRFQLFFFPVWLPPSARTEGGRFEELSVVGSTSWKAWTAWHATVGPANGYYDANTGFLVGLAVPRLGNLNARLTETNVPGLATSP